MSLTTRSHGSSDAPAPIAEADWSKLNSEERAAYYCDVDHEGLYGEALDRIYEALDPLGECHSPDTIERYEADDVRMVRRPEGGAAYAAEINLNGLTFDLRGDPFANAAEALRKLASQLEVAAERVEAARDSG